MSRWLIALLSLIAGALATLAFAPFNLTLLAVLSPALLYLFVTKLPSEHSALIGYGYGCGFFAAGVHWVFVSITQHSTTPWPLAVLMTTLFVMGLALLFLIQIKLWRRFVPNALGFIALWVVFEWLRSWLLTGFPWLYLGYSATENLLSAWLPIGGVWLASLILVSLAVGSIEWLRQPIKGKAVGLPILLLPLLITFWLPKYWVKEEPSTLTVTIVQADIQQAEKWEPTAIKSILERYQSASLKHLDSDLIIWPETAISSLYRTAFPHLSDFLELLDEQGIFLISGLPTADYSQRPVRYYNAMGLLTGAGGLYQKQRLVPFGEYIPLESQLRGLLDFFNLPMSSFSLPDEPQRPLSMNGWKIAPAICYEIAYPSLVRELAKESQFIVTLSNDTWFSHSIAPDQHMQIAKTRALENQRWVIRATNNGISGFISPDGESSIAPRYQPATLTSTVTEVSGHTPYQNWGDLPVLLFSTLLLGLGAVQHRRYPAVKVG